MRSGVRNSRYFVVLPALGVLLLVGYVLRAGLGLELSAEGIHAWMRDLGVLAPALYLAVFGVRQVLAIPSALLLPVAGLFFGATFGTLLGAAGLVLNAVVVFGISRQLATSAQQRLAGDGRQGTLARTGVIGLPAVGLVTAHPLGPLSPTYAAAGFSTIALGSFLLFASLGAVVRAFLYAFFGDMLWEPGSGGFWLATLLLGAALFLPLLHGGLRRRIFKRAPESGRP